jgi:hypothetical protein
MTLSADGLFDSLFYDADAQPARKVPFVENVHSLINGELRRETNVVDVISPIRRRGALPAGADDKIKIGTYALCSTETAIAAVSHTETNSFFFFFFFFFLTHIRLKLLMPLTTMAMVFGLA